MKRPGSLTWGFAIAMVLLMAHSEVVYPTSERVEGMHVRWVHFGGTANANRDQTVVQFMRTVDRVRQRPNMEVQLMGFMDNQAIMEWYANNAVDLFISMSSTEGLPVSMMEAISFGIPVLSTDVGGCREIVNDRTGMLIPLDTAVEEVARIIECLGKSRFVTSGALADVRAYWQEKFNADHNYADLFADIGR
jgi:glycosyltransferase involved in cell wall biosynthesis